MNESIFDEVMKNTEKFKQQTSIEGIIKPSEKLRVPYYVALSNMTIVNNRRISSRGNATTIRLYTSDKKHGSMNVTTHSTIGCPGCGHKFKTTIFTEMPRTVLFDIYAILIDKLKKQERIKLTKFVNLVENKETREIINKFYEELNEKLNTEYETTNKYKLIKELRK